MSHRKKVEQNLHLTIEALKIADEECPGMPEDQLATYVAKYFYQLTRKSQPHRLIRPRIEQARRVMRGEEMVKSGEKPSRITIVVKRVENGYTPRVMVSRKWKELETTKDKKEAYQKALEYGMNAL
jgi:hypothetical protein